MLRSATMRAGVVASLAGAALGTTWRVRAVVAAPSELDRLRPAIEARLAGIVGEMSQWEPASVLSRYNRSAATTWTTLPPDFAMVVAAALTVAERSGGAFDPTLGRAAALLGFGAEPASKPPDEAALNAAHDVSGWTRLAFDRGARRLRQPGGLWLDMSGIAKGFAVDALADLLHGAGIVAALVEIGGELAGRGLKPDGQPWWVDLEELPGAPGTPIRIGLIDAAVATSGDYVRGAHTLDPASGRPRDAGVAAVTVVHSRAMMADAWATALTVLGPEEGAALAAREGLAARWIAWADGGLVETLSPAFTALLEE